MKQLFKGVLVLLFAFMFIPLINAELIDNIVINMDTPVDGRNLINECGTDNENVSCRVLNWYKEGELDREGTLTTKPYDSSVSYAVEVALKANGEYFLGESTSYHLDGYPDCMFVKMNENGEAVVRMAMHPSHIVHFETNGGTHVDDIVVNHLGYLTTDDVTEPTKDGYSFYGWYEDSDFEDSYSFGVSIDSNVTLYALFINNNNVVNEIHLNALRPIVGQTVTVTPYIDPIWGFAQELQTPQPTVTPVDEEEIKYEVNATWVQGDCHNGSELCERAFEGTFESETYYYIDATIIMNEGYRLHPVNFNVYVNGDAQVAEVFAVYDKGAFTRVILKLLSEELSQEQVCSITFNMNGGGNYEGLETRCGAGFTLPRAPEVEAPANKILNGWKLGNTVYEPGEEVTINTQTTFEAVWANLYNVVFDMNGKDVENYSYQIKEGSRIFPPEFTPESAGSEFVGWCKDSECSEEFDFENERINSDTTIYANWLDDGTIAEVRLYSTTKRVLEGLLPEYTVTTTTPNISIEPYGSNTGWSKWAEGYSSWHGFGSEEAIAVVDGTTHYALRLSLNLLNDKKFNNNVRLYFNDENVTNVGYTTFDTGFSWGGYAYIDLGTAIHRDPQKPVISLTNKDNSITLSWDEQVVVEKAEIYRSEDNKKWKKVGTVTTNTFTNKGLTYGKKYYYKVRVYGNSKWSSYSNVVDKKILPNKVKLVIKSAGSNNVNLSWDKENITGYEVYSSINNKKWSKIKTITKNSTTTYNNTSLKANTKYYYKVRAYKTVSGKKVYGKYSDVVSTKTAPKKPGLKVTLKDYNAMNVTMESTKGASVYRLEKSLDGKTYELVEELPGAGVLAQEEQTLGVTYYFRVKACNSEKRCSGWVNVSLKQTTKTPKVTLKTTSKKVKITLGSVNGANGYQIYSSTKKNGKYTLLKEFSSEEELLEFTQKTKKGKYYYYKVRSFRLNEEEKRVYSPWSKIKSIRSK